MKNPFPGPWLTTLNVLLSWIVTTVVLKWTGVETITFLFSQMSLLQRSLSPINICVVF